MKLNEEVISCCMSPYIRQTLVNESTEEKLIGVTLDKKISFETYTQQLCIKANKKLQV